MPLSKNDILNADDIKLVPLDMKPYDWPGEVLIGKLKGRDLAKVFQKQRDLTKGIGEHDLAFMCSLFLRDENGQRIFGDEDYKALSEKSAVALQAILDKGNSVNGLAGDQIESAEKNSAITLPTDSASA